MKLTIKMTGDKAMAAKLKAIANALPGKMRAALYKRAEYIMTRSKNEFVPVDLGTLRSSGHVGQPKVSMSNVSIELFYGGPAAKYALAVHEHPSSYSPPSWKGKPVVFHPPGRGPKYLEKPLMQATATLAKDLAAELGFG